MRRPTMIDFRSRIILTLHKWSAPVFTSFWSWNVFQWYTWTLWTSDHSIDNIQHNLQNSLNNARRWLTSNQMVPNAKKTKQLLIATRQKLQNVNQLTLDLYVNRVTEGFSTFERFEHSTGTSVLVENIIAKAIRKLKRKVARLYQAKT